MGEGLEREGQVGRRPGGVWEAGDQVEWGAEGWGVHGDDGSMMVLPYMLRLAPAL